MRACTALLASTISFMALGVFAAQAAGLEHGLEGYWTFDDGRDADDISGNGREGVLVGGAELIDGDGAPVQGAPDGAAEFTGNGPDLIDCGPAPQIKQDLTLMLWASPEETGDSQYVAGCPYRDGGWDDPWFGYHIGIRGGKMNVSVNLKGNAAETGTGVAVEGDWHHCGFTFDGERLIAYVDGEEAFNLPRNGPIEYDGEPHFVIGNRSLGAPGEAYTGLIDEVALYSRVLDPDEIRNVMNGGVQFAVQPQGKVATSWGYIKVAR